jgi:HEAT repeat protein
MKRQIFAATYAFFHIAVLCGVAAQPSNLWRDLRIEQIFPPNTVELVRPQLENVTERDLVPALIQMLQSPKHEVRAVAVTLLTQVGNHSAIAPLWDAMRDEEESVRMGAAGAIMAIYNREKRPIVSRVDLLDDPRPSVRKLAASIFAQVRAYEAVPALVEKLDDPDESVRSAAALALGPLSRRDKAASVSRALIAHMRDPSALCRQNIVRSLAQMLSAGETTVISALREALQDEDWHVRAAACLALAHPEAHVALDDLSKRLLEDDYHLVRDRAAYSLGQHLRHSAGERRPVEALVQAVVSASRPARHYAAQALISNQARDAVPLLLPHANHPDPSVREKVYELVGELGDSSHAPILIKGLDDDSAFARVAAAVGLRKVAEKTAIDPLIALLKDPSPHTRGNVALTLGDLGDTRAVRPLIELLRDDHGYVRTCAAEALGKLGDTSAVPHLIEALTSAELDVQKEGGLVIGIESELLAETLRERQIRVKATAARALGDLGDRRAVDPLVGLLRDPEPVIRVESATALGKIGDPRAVTPLVNVVEPYYAQAPTEVETGPLLQTPEMPGLIQTMRERETRVRIAVALALGRLGDPRAEAILRRALQDENSLVREAAEEAITKIIERQEEQRLSGVTP